MNQTQMPTGQCYFNPNFQKIGEAFVKAYYSVYEDAPNKAQILNFYNENVLLTFEGDQHQGREAAVKKHLSLYPAAHAVTRTDCQPTADGGVLLVVLGQMKPEGEDKPLPYSHTFMLRDIGNDKFSIMNEIFQIGVHNF